MAGRRHCQGLLGPRFVKTGPEGWCCGPVRPYRMLGVRRTTRRFIPVSIGPVLVRAVVSGCSCRPSAYTNNVLEQDHRSIKKRIAASLWFRSVAGALNTIDGYEAMNMIRKGQTRWLAKGDVVGQISFIHRLFGIVSRARSPVCNIQTTCTTSLKTKRL
jgi:hypothetical protein